MWGKGWIRFGGRYDENTGFLGNRKLKLTGENVVRSITTSFLIRALSNLQVTRTSRNISDKFNFGLDQTIQFGVTCPWATKIFPIDLWKKSCPDDSYLTFDRIFINLACNQDSHKILDEFEFQPDWTIHFGVTCPWVAKKAHIWPCPISSAFSFWSDLHQTCS